MLASKLTNFSNITIRLSGALLVDNVFPYCNKNLLTSEIYDEFVNAFNKDVNCIVKYNQVQLKKFFAKVLDLSYPDDMLQAIIELCITRAIVIDCQL